MKPWYLLRLFSMPSHSVTIKNRHKARKYLKHFLFIVLLSGITNLQNAQAELYVDRTAQIKAAFILNIIRFVSWPDRPSEQQNDPLLICLYHTPPLDSAINIIDGKKAGGKIIDVVMIDSLSMSQDCHVIVVSNDAIESFIDEIHPGLDRPMLTIADFTEQQSAHTFHQDILVALVRNGSRISFQVNLKKSRQVGLRMSSKLLKLATIVGEGR